MVSALLNIWLSYLAGLFAPLGAVCILPLYPGFLSHLASQLTGEEDSSRGIIKLTWIITLGVLLSMFLIGLIFSYFLESSLTSAIGIISPIAFGILALVSVALIFDFDFSGLVQGRGFRILKNPIASSFVFGLFFGAIVIPCNPASLALLFAISTSVTGFITNLIYFIFFGIGMATPLIVFAYVSSIRTQQIIQFLSRHKRKINLVAGIIMLAISLYYLVFIFGVFNFVSLSENNMGYNPVSLDTEQMVDKDNIDYAVDPSKIISGGPPKDGIPSIDSPKFVSVAEADNWIADDELILAVDYNGIERIYPLQIMVWHEIVNDNIGGDPVLITYCPLCGSGIAYERKINGEEVEFGTSGKLYNSNLVMYDRKTDSYWSQIEGVAIVGPLTGTKLKAISIDTVVWGDWKGGHLDAEVLSQDTGYSRNYGADPYGSYYEDSYVWFPLESEDNRIHPKTVIFGIEVDGRFKAYREDDLIEVGEITDEFNGVNLVVKRSVDGAVTIVNLNNKEKIVKERDFWFAWYAFHPDTELYER
jgi:cytochrome c biogenesis protein CcdA